MRIRGDLRRAVDVDAARAEDGPAARVAVVLDVTKAAKKRACI